MSPIRSLRKAGIAALLAAFALTACERPKPVELAKKSTGQAEVDETDSAGDKATSNKTTGAKPKRKARTGPSASALFPDAAPQPVAPPVREPLIIPAPKMHITANGQPDGPDGITLTTNGALQIDNVKVEFPVREIGIEMRGSAAGGIWPEVDLNLYNRTTKTNSFPFARDFVTTSGYTMFFRNLDKDLEAGDYLVSFRYYNNSAEPLAGGDRNVSLKNIYLFPAH